MAGQHLRFGIYPAPLAAPWPELVDRARRAEEWGFDALWLADQTPMAYPDIIELEAWSTLGALAAATADIRLGTLVTPAFLRHPLRLAQAVSSVDHVSGGRVTLGLGAGGSPEDLAGVGLEIESAGELVDRLAEVVSAVDQLLRGETVTRRDGHFRMADARVPQPLQRPRPPLVIAAQGRRALEIAARHADTWNTLGGQPITGERVTPEAALAETARQVEALGEACARVDRDPEQVGRSIFAWRAGVFASAPAFEDWIGRYRPLGFTEFMLWWPTKPEQQRVLEQIATEVIPRLRAGEAQSTGSGR